jgi:hypothetical protein
MNIVTLTTEQENDLRDKAEAIAVELYNRSILPCVRELDPEMRVVVLKTLFYVCANAEGRISRSLIDRAFRPITYR